MDNYKLIARLKAVHYELSALEKEYLGHLASTPELTRDNKEVYKGLVGASENIRRSLQALP